jgi:hypothetical protein
MLPKQSPLLSPKARSLGEPLARTQDSLVDIVLEFRRVAKGGLCGQGILKFMGRFCAFHEPLEGCPRFAVRFDFPGSDSDFAFEFLGGHEEVPYGNRRLIDCGREGMFLKPFEPAVTDAGTDSRAVFLFNEAVFILIAVPRPGEGDAPVAVPWFGGACFVFWVAF